jgi:hypothetical protein
MASFSPGFPARVGRSSAGRRETIDGPALGQARERAMARGLNAAVYTEELFKTDNDADNRAAVRAVEAEAEAEAEQLNLVGVAVYGPRNAVDKAFKGLTLHS